MNVTCREKEMMDAIVSIGKRNLSMKEIANSLGVSYGYFMRKREEIAWKNGYATQLGCIIDYAVERAKMNARK